MHHIFYCWSLFTTVFFRRLQAVFPKMNKEKEESLLTLTNQLTWTCATLYFIVGWSLFTTVFFQKIAGSIVNSVKVNNAEFSFTEWTMLPAIFWKKAVVKSNQQNIYNVNILDEQGKRRNPSDQPTHVVKRCTLAVRWPLDVHWMVTEWSLDVHWMSTECSLNVHWMFTECWLNAHWMFTECSLNVHWMFTECSLNVHWMFPKYSLDVH
jgi:hypothetical protein